jgi:hypothetical protein
MKVKLVRKFANAINGVDLSSVRVGDTLDLKPHQAVLLIREGWAELHEEQSPHAKSEQHNG